jgi:hypothetical protein
MGCSGGDMEHSGKMTSMGMEVLLVTLALSQVKVSALS